MNNNFINNNFEKAFRLAAVNFSSPDMTFGIIKKKTEPRILSISHSETHTW